MSLQIKKGDRVRVRTGKDKGSAGRILEVLRDKRGRVARVLVEHVNMVFRHKRSSSTQQQGGIVEQEAPINISNVMLIDPETNEATRFGSRIGEDGRRERVSRRSGKPL
jgi:large subunit ribosomal protein L24